MDYDSAFADLNKALVDLDGDGKPDAVAPRAKLGANRLEPGEVPVQPEDTSSWWDRVKAAWASGGWQDPQPGQRGTFVPSRINEQGKAEPAVPGIIQQPAEGLQALMTAPLSDIVRSGDRDAMRAASDASFDVASMLPAAGVAAGRTIPEGAAGIFGGRLAKTADQAALKRAEDMAAKGAPREQIWQDTGWFKGVDGNWRFEIDDSKAAMTYPAGDVAGEVAKVMGVRGKMGDIFSHPDAYAAYPDASAIPGDIGLFRKGTYYVAPDKGGEQISVNAKDAERVPHTLHEFQHAIQDREGFGKGASVAGLRQQLQGRVPDNWLRDDVLMRAYARTAGEVESRAVEARADLTPDQRRARPPWLDYDVPESQQIVRLASNPDDVNTAAVLAAINAGNVDEALAKASARTPTTQPPRPPGYDRAPFQPDWPHWSLEYGLNARTHLGQRDIEMIDPRGIQPTETGVNGARIINGQLSDAGDAMLGRPASAVDALADGLRANVGQDAYVRPDGRKFYSNPDDPTTAAILATMTGQDKPKGITAYHGSPHDFDRFDMSKIGTGEGAQAYGHGLYFAEREGVARSYRDNLSSRDAEPLINGQPLANPIENQAALYLHESNGDFKTAEARLRQMASKERANAQTSKSVLNRLFDSQSSATAAKTAESAAMRLERQADIIAKWSAEGAEFSYPSPPGRMYEVRINADPADFLDWDKPFREQPEKIQKAVETALSKANKAKITPEDDALLGALGPMSDAEKAYDPLANLKGSNLISTLESQLSRPSAAEAMKELGIPGIRYLDQGSRTAGEGSRNYVVFDDALVEILRKYANAPDPTTAAILALLTAQQGGQPQQ